MRGLLAALTALTLLAGCSYFSDPSEVEGKVVSGARYRPGYGTIDSVGVLPSARRSGTAAAGGSPGNAPDPNRYRLFMRMDNGGFQTIDTDNPSYMAGEQVQVTEDGRIIRISGSSIRIR